MLSYRFFLGPFLVNLTAHGRKSTQPQGIYGSKNICGMVRSGHNVPCISRTSSCSSQARANTILNVELPLPTLVDINLIECWGEVMTAMFIS